MPRNSYTPEEVAARGEAIYQRDIRPHVESTCQGRFLVLDIESGQYEIDADDIAATKRARAKHPEGVLYGVRIGHSAAYRLGALASTEAR